MEGGVGNLTVDRSEFAQRCDDVLRVAHLRGYRGVLVWGRGGGPADGGADLLYLTDHYSWFPTIPDVPGRWTGRGYGAAVLSARGVTLVHDIHELTSDDVFATELVAADDVLGAVADACTAHGLVGELIGLVGQDVVTMRHIDHLRASVSSTIEPTDDLVADLRMLKSPAEQARIREACAVGGKAVSAIMAAAMAGRSEAEVVAPGMALAVQHGSVPYNAFADTFSVSSGRPARHRYPTYSASRTLGDGDIFAVDISGAVNGYLFDLSRSVPVGPGSAEHERVLDLARGSVLAAIRGLTPGATVGSAVRRGLAYLADAGYNPPKTDFAALGHGLGLGWERPWLLPDDETIVRPGMYIAVENFVVAGDLGASYEDDVLITVDGPEILTAVE
jgi:Xaa-Pro aminopeptidase